jgi:hypothetical protein
MTADRDPMADLATLNRALTDLGGTPLLSTEAAATYPPADLAPFIVATQHRLSALVRGLGEV